MHTIIEEYRRKHVASQKLYDESRQIFPDGVTHDVRYLTPFPIFMDHAQGPRKWDVDGNEYVDYVLGHGSLILGHGRAEVVGEVSRQIQQGTHLGFNTECELRWAKAIQTLMPWIEKLRFHSSGTEATMMACRLARAYTERNKILKFQNHFHGWHDYAAVAVGNYISPGIPANTAETVLMLVPGDIAAVERTLKTDRDVAAVILEPTGGKMGALPLQPEFLQQLREMTQRYRVLLIFDEVVTGFRIASGGAQGRFGLRPDLTTLGKVLSGGYPGGAVGGKAEIMEMISHREDDEEWNASRRIAHPGTHNANAVSATAGAICLEIISREPINQKAEEMGEKLKQELNRVLRRDGVRGFAHGYGSIIHLVFGMEYEGDLHVCTAPHEALLASNNSRLSQAFRRAMLNNGMDVMGGDRFLLSAVHRDRDIEDAAAAFEKSIGQMRKEGLL